MSIAKIEANARRALGHKDLQWLVSDLPAGYADNPAALRALLVAAGQQDPKFSDSAAYHAAHSALAELQQTRDLRDTVARLYHDPKLRAQVGDDKVEAAWRNPEMARQFLIQRSVTTGLSPELDLALNVIGEARQFASEQGIAEPAPAAVPIPTDSTKRETEIATLRTKSVGGTLSKAEDARLNQLYEARIGRETGAEAAAPRQDGKKPAGEFERLIGKSVGGKLSPAEDSRLNELSQARAVEQGLVDIDDLSDHGDVSEEGTGT
jgi:type VI protein secretion system component VasK